MKLIWATIMAIGGLGLWYSNGPISVFLSIMVIAIGTVLFMPIEHRFGEGWYTVGDIFLESMFKKSQKTANTKVKK